MGRQWRMVGMLWLAVSVSALSGQEKPGEAATGGESVVQRHWPRGMSAKEVEARVFQREQEEIAAIALYTPIAETYIQRLRGDAELGVAPARDEYYLGLVNFGTTKYEPMEKHGGVKHFIKSMGPGMEFEPAGFTDNVFADRNSFRAENYELKFGGQTFLGEVRCLIFDVQPKNKNARWKFVGRIWVEDQDFTIVRINGVHNFRWKNKYYPHFDAWRMNVAPGVWLPSSVYSEEATSAPWRQQAPSFKAQTKFWRYRQKEKAREEEFAKIIVDSNNAKDEEQTHDRTPLQALEEFRDEGERNVLDLLEENGLLAAPGPVDKVLNTIINNLEVSANLSERVDLHARVLLTSNFDCFKLDKTVVISRGLMDVVPDEGTLAVILAQLIANALEPDPYFNQYAFSDMVRLKPTEIIEKLSFKTSKEELESQESKTVEIVKKSPYAGNLAEAALFFKQMGWQEKELRELIRPSMGNKVRLAEALQANAPELKVLDVNQHAALPIGSRVKLNPWTDELVMLKTQATGITSAREKLPFEITPLRPWLTRAATGTPKLASGVEP